MPSRDLIDRLGLGRVEVSFFIELEPGEAGEVPQATRKLDKDLAKIIEIGDVLEARFPPDNKWGAVLRRRGPFETLLSRCIGFLMIGLDLGDFRLHRLEGGKDCLFLGIQGL